MEKIADRSGIFILDKPTGISTNNFVQQVKKKFNFKKIGHAGTLDPLASGIVLCLVNQATKISDLLLDHDKEYFFKIKLFEATDTFDSDGKIIQTQTPFKIELNQLNQVIEKYNNYTYNQIPPIYSAIKVKGKKLLEYARKNLDVEIKPRMVRIKKLTLIENDQQFLSFKATCSKGTYIRSLAVDLAKELGAIAHVIELRRIKYGNFEISNNFQFDQLSLNDLLPLKKTIETIDYPIIVYSPIENVVDGKKITLDNQKSDLIFVANQKQEIFAMYIREEGNIFKCKRGGMWEK